MSMEEVRCPLCGKPNPAELEVCQFCEARLKPLTGAGNSELEDWLGSLRSGSSGESQTPSTPSWERSEDDSADWLASLRKEPDVDDGKAQESGETEWWAPPPGTDAQDEGFPDWLADIRSQAVDAEPAAPPQAARPDRPTASAPLPREDAEPDWLQRVRARKQEDEGTPPEEPAASTDEPLPDWLAGLGGAAAQEASQEQLPDWLSSSETPLPAPGMQPPSDDIPEWLLGRQRSQDAQGEPQAEAEVPDWLTGLSQETASPDMAEAEADAGRGDQAGWFTGLEQPAAEEPAAPPASIFSAPQDAELPSWLSGLAAAVPEQAPPDAEQEESEAAGILFDEQADGAPSSSAPPFEGERPSQPLSGRALDGTISPFTEDLPGWEEEPLAGEEASEPVLHDEPGLARAEMPSWLEAMRPVEAAAPVIPLRSQDEQKVISSGPLAGLRGVLPADAEIASQRAPAAYTLKLQLNDTHQAQAEMLEKMVKKEGTPRELRESPVISSQQLLRLVVFFALVAAVLAQSVFGLVSVPAPAPSSAVFSARAAVDSLTAGAPVLVAVDYPAGFSGEMEAVASGLLDHLMIKGTYLALVSSQPAGPALAEHLIGTANAAGGHTYNEIGQYANLGYIPGGTAGLFAFVHSPRRVVPFALNSNGEHDPWKTGPLANVNAISDFGLVIVITNDPENARAWVEQTRTGLAEKPLLMLVSAQAEPVVRPYYEGKPQLVNGMLAGVAGGAAYEASLVRSGMGGRYWAVLGPGVNLAVIMILLFGVLGWVIDRFGQSKGSPSSRKESAS